MLHTDIPTQADITRLIERRHPASVTVYLPTSVISAENDRARIELKNLMSEAVGQLRETDTPKADIEAIEEELLDLLDDSWFWSYTSNSLAIFVTPDALQTFRLPSRLTSRMDVADRFLIKPLLRAVTFPHAAFVLALSQSAVRLIEVSADSPAFTIDIPDLPRSAAAHARKTSIADRGPSGRIQGSEGQKVRLRQYARGIVHALRPALTGSDLPLIIAGAEPLASIYRSVNTYAHLADAVITGNPQERTDAELAEAARPLLDELYAATLAAERRVFEARASAGRTALDLGDIARAATFGAVEMLFVDIDDFVPGLVDEATGAVVIDPHDDGINYGVVDEVVRRVLLHRGRILAVRRDDVPGGGTAAATLRYVV